MSTPGDDEQITAVQATRLIRQMQTTLAAVEETRRRGERREDRVNRLLRWVIAFATVSITADIAEMIIVLLRY